MVGGSILLGRWACQYFDAFKVLCMTFRFMTVKACRRDLVHGVGVQTFRLDLNDGGVGPCHPEPLDHVFTARFPDTMTRKNARFIE
jgi:hypothetical protein